MTTLRDGAKLLDLPSDTMLTTDEAASVVRLSPVTLRRWASTLEKDRLLPSVRRAGRNLYQLKDIKAWLEQGRPESNGAR